MPLRIWQGSSTERIRQCLLLTTIRRGSILQGDILCHNSIQATTITKDSRLLTLPIATIKYRSTIHMPAVCNPTTPQLRTPHIIPHTEHRRINLPYHRSMLHTTRRKASIRRCRRLMANKRLGTLIERRCRVQPQDRIQSNLLQTPRQARLQNGKELMVQDLPELHNRVVDLDQGV